ncbi:MAG: DUF1641 domain-containing protein [Anaerolineae bacterium]|nr:DUF1641 domain-containing protein [Anaerolineae bacterium]
MALQTTASTDEIALLHQKVDRLTELLEAQERRQQELEELKDDVLPLMTHAMSLTIEELDDIGMAFRMEDLLYLAKRLLRNTTMFIKLMDQLEAVAALSEEAELLGKQVFANLVETMGKLEAEGYFAFMRGAYHVLDGVVHAFDEDDLKALGDKTVPMMKGAVDALTDESAVPDNVSLFYLARQMNDPQVRRGMARMLNLVKAMGELPPAASSSNVKAETSNASK